MSKKTTKKTKKTTKKRQSSNPVKSIPRMSGAVIADSIRLPQRMVGQIADEVVRRIKRESNLSEDSEEGLDKPIYVDTSAIIDGRFFELAEMGVFGGSYVLISGVLSELKNIADSKDPLKRERGRVALKALEKFKKQMRDQVVSIETVSEKAVDDVLIDEAKKSKGRVVTCDFNLTKKARIEGVPAIDLYEMANVLKTPAIPGDQFTIDIMQKGKGVRQGVGYLPDGTMIVVEDGEGLLGQTTTVTVTRVIQTEAGKIFFGRATS